ncbi:MAG: ABC transporter ATP-binding protein [Candidatus Bathyarchaeota archaeon]|nr:ABC transporter ATP-binding protein [Candidatus Bathyarchaeota archaeon]
MNTTQNAETYTSGAEDKPVIETHGLCKTFNGTTALKSLDLRVPKNSIFGFLGPNGAGKTTTIKLLLGLSSPTAGEGKVFGKDIKRESIAIRSRIGYLAQDPVFYDHMTARETLRYKLGFFFKGPRDKIEERIQETLQLVGLDDKADRPIKGFSGGERQRLGIALAQVTYPDLLILDEPAANLDPMGRRYVLEIMEKLREHATIFYSTHILDDVQKVSDTVAILNKGVLVAQAPIEELLKGSTSIVYTVVLEGSSEEAEKMIQSQDWVSSVEALEKNGRTTLQITVTEEKKAESELLRTLMSIPDVQVNEFGKDNVDLEDVFMKIVEDANNDD